MRRYHLPLFLTPSLPPKSICNHPRTNQQTIGNAMPQPIKSPARLYPRDLVPRQCDLMPAKSLLSTAYYAPPSNPL
ncbi:hypothetical protein EmuJ_001172500 [Echinococcus multilocularis]|uniref:Uncharacterized protein n=1 Tax=Echinococcus multilocularis TaxID=6211 RepID=A0A068Y061_ECHMU|nr:hypothetical protein EmuJ_001172500 [Echinococcus multilocularis]